MPVRPYEPWKVNDLPWHTFDKSKVNGELLKIVKAAALVEYNASDYAIYLKNIFPEDAAFCQDAQNWSIEETQHGEALGKWAQLADPSFDFDGAFSRYTAGYRINVAASQSVRGSKMGELIARCIVETGTSSYYSALADATDEPMLKTICRLIAADELRHYSLFHRYLKIYSLKEKLWRLTQLKIGLSRVQESEDDELAYAYFSANAPLDAVYNRATYTSAYMVRAFPLYKSDHIERMVAMIFRACGFTLSTFLRKFIKRLAQGMIQAKLKRALPHDKEFMDAQRAA